MTVNIERLMESSIEKHNVEALKFLVNYAIINIKRWVPSDALLIKSIVCNQTDCLRTLLKETDVNLSERNFARWSPLHKAIQCKNIEGVKLLLEHGAITGILTNWNGTGVVPLYLAIDTDNIEYVKLLLEHGADVNNSSFHTNYRTRVPVLFIAILQKTTDIIRLLLEHGADINYSNNAKASPLDVAIHIGYMDGVKLLLEHGASINNKGVALLQDTALKFCIRNKYYEIAQLLIEHMKKQSIASSDHKELIDLIDEAVDEKRFDIAQQLLACAMMNTNNTNNNNNCGESN